MDIHHLMLSCRIWTEERRKMREKYEKDVGNPRTVRQLLSSRKMTALVLRFIKVTRAGQRAQRQEQDIGELEQEKDEAWGLEKDKLEGDNQAGNTEGEQE